MLTKKAKKELYDAGADDTYTNDVLCEGAEHYIDNKLGGFKNFKKLSEADYQEAVEIYSAGFYGDDYEGIKTTKKGLSLSFFSFNELEVDVLKNAIDRRIEEVEENLMDADSKATRLAYGKEKRVLLKLFKELEKYEKET